MIFAEASACSANGNSDELGKMETLEKVQINAGDGSSDPLAANENDSFAALLPDDISLDDCPEYVFSTGEGKLLLVGEGLTLLDCNTLEIVGQNRNPGLDFNLEDLLSCKLTVLEEEYILLGNWVDFGEAEALGNGTFMRVSEEEPEFKMTEKTPYYRNVSFVKAQEGS